MSFFAGIQPMQRTLMLIIVIGKIPQRFIPAFAKQSMYYAASALFPGRFNQLDTLKFKLG